jgi:hypothetical protein
MLKVSISFIVTCIFTGPQARMKTLSSEKVYVQFLIRGLARGWVHSARRPLVGPLYRYLNRRWNKNLQRKPKHLKNICPLALCPPLTPYDLTWDRTGSTAVGSWRLISWVMAQPRFVLVAKVEFQFECESKDRLLCVPPSEYQDSSHR